MINDTVWVFPDLAKEYEEFQRVAAEEKIPTWCLLRDAEKGSLVDLEDSMWSILENTDSWGITLAIQLVHMAAAHSKNLYLLLNKSTMDAPIILMRPGKKPTLVAGNTRLMICRARGVHPKVLVFHSGLYEPVGEKLDV